MSVKTPTAAEQIAMMSALTQKAAAWLLGRSHRTVQDYSLPREADGSFDARKVLTWAVSHQACPSLSDVDYERLLLVRDLFVAKWYGDRTDGIEVGCQEALQSLEAKHGSGVRVVLADLLCEWLEAEAAFWLRFDRATPPTAEEVRADLAERKHALAERLAETRKLQISVQCPDCKRVRFGRQWCDKKPPVGYVVKESLCPNCVPA